MSSLNRQLDKKVNQLLQSLDQRDQLSVEMATSHDKAPATKELLTQLASAVISQQQEKERHQLNVVIHNIEESSSDLPQARKQDGIEKVASIIDIIE